MRVLLLAWKDLRQIQRDRLSAIFLILIPVAMTVFLIIMNGSGGGGQVSVGLRDSDTNGALAGKIGSILENTGVTVVAMDSADQAQKALHDGTIAAFLTIPPGYGANILAGHNQNLAVSADLTTANGQIAYTAIQTAAQRIHQSVQVAQISTQAYASKHGFASDSARATYEHEALTLAIDAWHTPAITVTTQAGSRLTKTPDVYTQVSPGLLVQMVFMGLITTSMVLLFERESWTLQRMLTTPISRMGIIAGHVLAMFVVVLGQEALLIALGQLAFRINYLREPVAILLVMGALALFVACLGLLIGTIARAREQVIMYGLLIMFAFALLGGCWFSLEGTGQTFNTIGHLTPGAWAMDGFQNIIMREEGLSSVLLPAAVLAGYAAACFALAVWLFGKTKAATAV